mmetsp:Transcript_136898/g.355377  ORF Transcript_136898/g.355377 Transcript_136898/m.355377 type:complete len:107 (+) Transcript_136898:439-759(+)
MSCPKSPAVLLTRPGRRSIAPQQLKKIGANEEFRELVVIWLAAENVATDDSAPLGPRLLAEACKGCKACLRLVHLVQDRGPVQLQTRCVHQQLKKQQVICVVRSNC